MKGVQFMVDGTGRKTGVVIDLRKNPEFWEDLFDRALVRKRKGELRKTFDAVKQRLIKNQDREASPLCVGVSRYEITFARSARRELEALQTQLLAHVWARIQALGGQPRPLLPKGAG